MEAQTGRAEDIAAHLTVFSVGIAQRAAAIRAFLAGTTPATGRAIIEVNARQE